VENASKALIMATSILVGVLIISLATYLFATFSEYGREHAEAIVQKQVDQFNNKFFKYLGTEIVGHGDEEYTRPILVKAHDIITLTNLARQNNIDQEVAEYVPKNEDAKDSAVRYITVKVKGVSNSMEKLDEKAKNEFASKGTELKTIGDMQYQKYYKCTGIKQSDTTKYVYWIEFVELTDAEYTNYVREE